MKIQDIYLIKDFYLEYVNNLCDTIIKRQITQLKNGQIFEWTCTKENVRVAKKHMERCLISLVIRKMQIKTIRYHFTPTRMAILKNIDSSKYWLGCGKTRILMYWWWECKMAQPFWKTLPSDQTASFLDTYHREMKTLCPHEDLYVNVIAAVSIWNNANVH